MINLGPFDKSQRVAKLARELCEKRVINADPDLAERVRMLRKADQSQRWLVSFQSYRA